MVSSEFRNVPAHWSIGVDVGGTFTDLYARGPDGRVHVVKRASTPGNPAEAVQAAVRTLLEREGIEGASVRRFAHGTTVGTNALLERRGGKVALVTTRGFRDLLEIGRQTRPHMYDLFLDQPAPLVPRSRRLEVTERIDAVGKVIVPLTEAALDSLIAEIRAAEVEACAICLLFGFLEPAHERRIVERLRAQMPELAVSASHEVQPEFREFERCSTTVLNAYLQPVMASYLERIESQLRQLLPTARIGINQSSGGLMSPSRARELPVRTALSGPAAGVIGAGAVARAAAVERAITLDMGGTSTDVALIDEGRVAVHHDGEVGGYPIRLPMVDVATVGAGGGSIAWFDRDGMLKVGPRSAGAEPGPACYGRGGTEPTITDANVVLGRLSPRGLLAGSMALDAAAAARAIAPVADRLGFSIERTALGIIDIAVANMVRTIRKISIERGHDPRRCSLIAFGGAGPLHARQVASALGIHKLVIPARPGILCAHGLLVANLQESFVASRLARIDAEGSTELQGLLEGLVEQARAWFEAEAVEPRWQRLELTVDARYAGQNFELPVRVWGVSPDVAGASEDQAGETASASSVGPTVVGATVGRWPGADALCALFRAEHERAYGYANPTDPIEAVNLRLTAIGVSEEPPGDASVPGRFEAASSERRAVWYAADAPAEAQVFDRLDLGPGAEVHGPSVIEQLDSTSLLFSGDRARVVAGGNLEVSLSS